MIDQLIADLKRDEGWRPNAYQDSRGYLTIGFGFLVDDRKSDGMPKEIGEAWLRLLVADKWAELTNRLPWVMDQPEDVQRALCNMAYQMGMDGLLGFRRMLAALQSGKRDEAALHALDSEWAREQTPARARRVAELIRGHE